MTHPFNETSRCIERTRAALGADSSWRPGVCDSCQVGFRVIKWSGGTKPYFWACTNYPKCTYTGDTGYQIPAKEFDKNFDKNFKASDTMNTEQLDKFNERFTKLFKRTGVSWYHDTPLCLRDIETLRDELKGFFNESLSNETVQAFYKQVLRKFGTSGTIDRRVNLHNFFKSYTGLSVKEVEEISSDLVEIYGAFQEAWDEEDDACDTDRWRDLGSEQKRASRRLFKAIFNRDPTTPEVVAFQEALVDNFNGDCECDVEDNEEFARKLVEISNMSSTSSSKAETKEKKTMGKKTVREVGSLAVSATMAGAEMAVVDAGGEILLKGVQEAFGNDPFVAMALNHPMGKELIKYALSLGMLTLSETTEVVPAGETVSRLATRQMQYSSAKVGSAVALILAPHMEKLIGVGKQLERLEAKKARIAEDLDKDEAEATEEAAAPKKARSSARA